MRLNLFTTRSFRFDLVLLLYRIMVSSSLIVVHGLQKLINFQNESKNFPDPLGLGITFTFYFALVASVICPVFIIAGLFTRVACAVVLTLTLSGLFLVHLHSPLSVADTPYIYSVGLLLILFLGPGAYSLDNFFSNGPTVS
jgi:putative oxidoreductase